METSRPCRWSWRNGDAAWLAGPYRPMRVPWRAGAFEPDPGIPELDEQVAQLHAFSPESPEHLLGDVLGYWRREWLAYVAPKLAQTQAEPTALLDEPDVLAGLVPVGLVERVGRRRGTVLKRPAMRLEMPTQVTDAFEGSGDQVVYTTPAGTGYSTIDRLDRDVGRVDLIWSERSERLGAVPSVVVLNEWVSPKPKPAALSEFASRLLNPTARRAGLRRWRCSVRKSL